LQINGILTLYYQAIPTKKTKTFAVSGFDMSASTAGPTPQQVSESNYAVPSNLECGKKGPSLAPISLVVAYQSAKV
jgi:hypothetical protein